MPDSGPTSAGKHPFHVLVVSHGLWGERIAEHISRYAPADWSVVTWSAPRVIPQVVDDPDDFLPAQFAPADLLLALGEVAGLAQLIPDIVRLSGARAVIAPIDRNASLPPGLATQLDGWLAELGVNVAFPKPFCSLAPGSYNRPPLTRTYDDPWIRRFAEHFGRPEFKFEIDDGRITQAEVTRDSACGCARYVAENLVGRSLDEGLLEEAGLLHHHFPCLADMNQDPDYRDTLMHVSGNLLKDAVADELKDQLSIVYLRPHGKVGEAPFDDDPS